MTLIYYILQFDLKKLAKNYRFSPQIPKDSVFDKTARTIPVLCAIPMIIQYICLFK